MNIQNLNRSVFRFIGTRNWLRLGIRFRVFKKFKPRDCPFVIPFFGYSYRGNLNNYIDRTAYFYGAYEKENLELLRRFLDERSVVLDMGANTGHHSLFFSSIEAEVHAFEPFPEFVAIIRERIRENRIHNIHVHPVGLGDTDEFITYYKAVGDNLGLGSFFREHAREKDDKNTPAEKLPIRAADRYISNMQLKRIDVIKIDVEGYEKKVLEGLQRTLKKYRPIVMMEFSRTTQQSFSTLQEFSDLIPGYLPYAIRANQPRWILFNDPRPRTVGFNFSKPRGDVLLIPAGKYSDPHHLSDPRAAQ